MTPKSSTPAAAPRYSLRVEITKTNQDTIQVEHHAVVESNNLTLGETVDMTKPLLAVLQAWVEQDAE